MGLTADVAIVTAAEVAAITHEAGLSNLDDGLATLAATLPQATNFLIVDLKARGVPDVGKIANVSDLKLAAAFKVAEILFASQPQGDEENSRKRADYASRYADQVKKFVFESSDGGAEQTRSPFGLPVVLNTTSEAVFNVGRDTQDPRRGQRGPRPVYRSV